jgi:hypothetical protein
MSYHDRVKQVNSSGEKSFSGRIEGWLAVYVLGVVIGLFVIFFDLLTVFNFNVNDYETTIQGDLQNYISYATIFDVVFLAAYATILFLIFTKNKSTRAFVISIHLFYIVGAIVAYSMLSSIVESAGGDTTSQNLSILTLGSFLWPLYWWRSKRVKETFR